ncbi:Cystathionine beta-lyase family protein involved in aluminum resistance [Lachnospiraceae bacterium NE2001]|nr:Cystathionine beta-lyase family protein involved in aluminum resistance [Lachnospiraceae bacterium NE2001]
MIENTLKEYYLQCGISEKVYDYCAEIEARLKPRFEKIDKVAELNQIKVQQAMARCRLAEEHLRGTTGYGYNDSGRDTLEKIYAEIFHTEDALVRQQITCGTHALTIALAGNLRPGDEILSVAGAVYDTLQGVIGVRPEKGSLAEYGITYNQVDLLPNGGWDYDGIKTAINDKTKLIEIQRSKGYDTRPSLSVEAIGEVIAYIREIEKEKNTHIIIMVDNCYGEFVETIEPSDVGADMVVGSLIKNIGGGLAPIGGYICGTKECVENCAARLITPGIGKEVGASLGITAQFAEGLFLAPTVTAAALKGAIFAANVYEGLGFKAIPDSNEERYDIIEAVTLGKPELIEAFCEGIQSAAPVDSFVKPVPWAMPGYDSDVIMAAGAFISGASIELSADAPMKEPYAVYFQGGLTYPHAKFGIMMSLQKIVEKNLIVW